uniref:Limb development membrane protein 1 n=1 Tax=Balaenoptera musculus TaxID=9771 RepID=A0A8C0D7B1_BALMU
MPKMYLLLLKKICKKCKCCVKFVLFQICFLLFAILYIVSYFIITRYKRKSDEQEDEDAIVNRISLFLSTFTLAVSAGAVLLLPFSIISNEILLSFPQNYYIQWLNGSLIHGLWNLASLFSNLCLFVLMPFAFFFLESEGFAGLKKCFYRSSPDDCMYVWCSLDVMLNKPYLNVTKRPFLLNGNNGLIFILNVL